MAMANIGTSIELYDKLSRPINNMIGAINNMIGAYQSLDRAMDSGFDTAQINEARGLLASATHQIDQMGDYIRQNEQAQEQFNQEVKNGTVGMDGLTSKVMGLVGAYASFQGVQKLVNLSDEYTQTSARLKMIKDEQNDVESLQNKIFASAQRSRASYADTADMVAKISMRTDGLFSNDEAILFAENLNKMYTIAGASSAEMKSSQLQLLQAMGSGVLRGEEFNAVYEAAPNIMQTLAESMGVPITSLREMAADGKITANAVKKAMLGATKDINTEFKDMPMTWAQVWTGVMNELYFASQPLLEFISLLAKHWSTLEPIVIVAATAIGLYAATIGILNGVQATSNFLEGVHAARLAISQGLTLAQAAATKTATGAQVGLNAALLASPLGWVLLIIVAIIAAVYAVVAIINKCTNSTVSGTGVILGALATVGAFLWNVVLAWFDIILGYISMCVNQIIAWINLIGNVVNDPIGAIIHAFGFMADNVLGILETIAKAIDKVFGTDGADKVSHWRNNLDNFIKEAAYKYGNGSYEKIVNEVNWSSETLGLKRWAYSDAYKTGYGWGTKADEIVSGAFNGELLTGIEENTGICADSLEITSEDLKYLRDIAERDIVNRFTTAEIKVDMTNNNNISGNMDLDGVVDYLVVGVNEAMEKAAEGVHV